MADNTPSPPNPVDYNASYEWPGLDDETNTSSSELSLSEPSPGTTRTSFFRLVVVQSAVFPSKHRIAVLTGYPEVQIGRDKPLANSPIPRIRLKEMGVSKIHATVYWNGAAGQWALVDMGSMHGTFWRSNADSGPSSSSGPTPTRLSQPRVASLPRPLQHLDLVMIGSTTFTVHIHNDDLACSDCALAGSEIPMFHSASRTTSLKGPGFPECSREGEPTKVDPKRSLALLKQSLLHQHARTVSSTSKYTDRADRRRRMYGSLPVSPSPPQSDCWRPQPLDPPPNLRPVISDPPQRLTSSNVGHNLLTKMGWQEGTTLGLSLADAEGSTHLLDPIQVKHTVNRAGLGAARDLGQESGKHSNDWKELEKRKRYDMLSSK